MHVTSEDIHRARKADLYGFLQKYHPDSVRRTGHNLYLKSDRSVGVRYGFPGFSDFEYEGVSGNSIDFLIKYLGYGFPEAVAALIGDNSTTADMETDCPQPAITGTAELMLPPRAPDPRRLYACLRSRGIPDDVIGMLIDKGVLYQDAEHGNLVFVSPEKDCFEMRGTLSTVERPFRQNKRLAPDRCWYFTASAGPARRVYVCEASIDAISLYVLHRKAGMPDRYMYASLGGVCNQKPIDRFVAEGMEVVLAVDHDDAGEKCRIRNAGIRSIIPKMKDWNQDLTEGVYQNCYVHPAKK